MEHQPNTMKSALLGEETSETTIESCLARTEYGILGLANGGDAYTVPLSFGHDDELETLYFMLAFAQESRKATFIETTDKASFVVADANLPDEWKSVILTGSLEVVPEDEQIAAYEAFAETTEFPAPYTFEEYFDTEGTEQILYRMQIESCSGRCSNPAFLESE